MPAAIQASLHGQAARVLGAREAPALVVARHQVRAGDGGAAGAVALDHLRRAVHELGRTDPGAALELLDRAVALPLTGEGARAELLVERVGLLAAAGRLTEGEATARDLLATDVAPPLRTDLELALSEVLLLAGDATGAVAVLDGAGERGVPDDVARGRVVAGAAWARLVGFDLDGAARDAALAVASGERHGDAVVLTSGLAVQCRLAAFAVDFARAIERGRAAVEASARGGTHAARRTPHYYLGLSLMNADRGDEAIAVLNDGRRIAESAGLVSASAMYHAALITCCFHTGRWDDGTAEAEAARLLQADTGTRRGVMQMESMLGLMWLHRGEEPAAREALARAEADLAAPGYDIGGVIWLRWLRAAFAEANGDVAEAARLLVSAFGLVRSSGVESVKLWFGPEAVRLAADCGDTARAADIAGEVARVAGRAGTAGAAGAADACAGMAGGDADRLAAAAEAYRRSPRRLDLARASEARGRLLADRGRVADAVDAYDEAIGVYETLGAAHDVRRMESRLRELGVRRGARGARARPRTGPESLTSAEREVLRLVAEGLTNSQVAERLFVSRRTVETHVGHLYAKLGVRGRVALARSAPPPPAPPG
jgi:DNA-binding CsgD family transcriptional regulator